jgi:hypothetical protein
MNYFMVRAGYNYEDGINGTDRTTALTGLNGGVTIQAPLNKEKGSNFSIDYAYRTAAPFRGCHTFAARLSF